MYPELSAGTCGPMCLGVCPVGVDPSGLHVPSFAVGPNQDSGLDLRQAWQSPGSFRALASRAACSPLASPRLAGKVGKWSQGQVNGVFWLLPPSCSQASLTSAASFELVRDTEAHRGVGGFQVMGQVGRKSLLEQRPLDPRSSALPSPFSPPRGPFLWGTDGVMPSTGQA